MKWAYRYTQIDEPINKSSTKAIGRDDNVDREKSFTSKHFLCHQKISSSKSNSSLLLPPAW